MLSITIDYYKDGTISMQEISDDDNVLAVATDNIIDLNVCVPYINKNALVHNNYVDDVVNSYTSLVKIKAIDFDETTNSEYIEYSILKNIVH